MPPAIRSLFVARLNSAALSCVIIGSSTFPPRRPSSAGASSSMGTVFQTPYTMQWTLEFFLRLADAGCRFQHLPEVLADFRVHSASKSVAFRSRQRAEHRRVVLQTTPLAHCFHSPGLRNLAAASLQIPAALLRYSEKLFRGFYFPSSRATGQRLPVPSRPEQS